MASNGFYFSYFPKQISRLTAFYSLNVLSLYVHRRLSVVMYTPGVLHICCVFVLLIFGTAYSQQSLLEFTFELLL